MTNKTFEFDNCAICLDNINKNNVKLNCKHSYCNSCILFVRDRRCPICRKNYKLKITLNPNWNTKKEMIN
jgi:late competence protein required for DNA uptake (superfamily II DNA/RNA helicase)